MKSTLPSDTKISKEARECVQECVSEFISFITCESCETCMAEKRKTINGEDLIKAMRELAFDAYIPHTEYYNKKYKDALKKQQDDSEGPALEVSQVDNNSDNMMEEI